MSSSTSRRLSENRRYQRTQVTIISAANCRFRNGGFWQNFIRSPYQIRHTEAATLPDNRSCSTFGEMLAGLYKGLSTATNAPRLVSLRSSTADDSGQYKSVSVNVAIQRVRTARR